MSEQDSPRYSYEGPCPSDDPADIAQSREQAKKYCGTTFNCFMPEILHLHKRAAELGIAPSAIIVIVSLGYPFGQSIGNLFSAQNGRGVVISTNGYFRALANRGYMHNRLLEFDEEAAAKIHAAASVPILIIDHGTAEVFYI